MRRTCALKVGGVVDSWEPRRRWEAVERRRPKDGRGGGASGETRGERDGDRGDGGDGGLGGESSCEVDRSLKDMVEALTGWTGRRELVFRS